MAPAQDLAQQRARAYAQREHHQQGRRHLLVAAQHILGKAGELGEEHRAEEPHPRDAQQRAEDDDVAVRQLEVAPGLAHRVPVDHQSRVGGRRAGNELRRQPPCQRQAQAGQGDGAMTHAGHGHQQAAGHIAQQDGDEGAHLHHAIAAGELALAQDLRQVGELDRPEQRGMQAHQEHAGQQQRGMAGHEAQSRHQHDGDLQVLHETDDARLLELVGELPGRGRKQQERQDEQRPYHQARQGRRQPGHAELVGNHHGEGELEQVVVGGAGGLGPEKRCKATLAEQRKLVGVLRRGRMGAR